MRLELIGGASRKFWSGKVEGQKLIVTYGRIGGTGQVVRSSYASNAYAKAALAKLIGEKVRKGYVAVKTPSKPAKPAVPATSVLTRKGRPELQKQIAKLRKDIAKAGLAERTIDIEAITRWSVRMLTKPVKKPQVGASRIGGLPDLPSGFGWPMAGKERMVFAAQIRMDEASRHDVDGLLPKRGMLSLFLDPHFEDLRVAYFEDPRKLVPVGREVITEEMWKVPDHPCSVAFRTEYSLPPAIGPTIDTLDLDEEDLAIYNDAIYLDHVPDDRDPHHLLGYPGWSWNYLQSTGVELLFQIGSDSKAGMQWGDAQPAFVYISRKHLAARNFAKAFVAYDG